MKRSVLGVIVGGLLAASLVSAEVVSYIPYPDAGTANPDTYTFQACGNGDIIAYFYGSDADLGSEIGLVVNNLTLGTYGLPNHASAYGQSFNMGYANSGDILEFLLIVSSGDIWSSNPSDNVDGLNHAYSAAFAGDNFIPAGTYVGFEDLPQLGDKDYNDHQFVFTGVCVPDGGTSCLLLGLGLAGLGMIKRKLA
jgi:hypothetical protein